MSEHSTTVTVNDSTTAPPPPPPDADVIILGSGLAGSVLGAVLAKGGPAS